MPSSPNWIVFSPGKAFIAVGKNPVALRYTMPLLAHLSLGVVTCILYCPGGCYLLLSGWYRVGKRVEGGFATEYEYRRVGYIEQGVLRVDMSDRWC